MSRPITDDNAYPFNLLNAVEGSDWTEDIPYDIESTLQYIFHHLSERERIIIEGRFQQCQSYRDLGQQLNITCERVHQIENKVLKKLQAEPFISLLKFGVIGCVQHCQLTKIQNDFIGELSKATRILQICADRLNKITGNQTIAETEKLYMDGRQNAKIEVLNLPDNILNCLHRAQIFVIGDILHQDLTSVRNLGVAKLRNIVQQLRNNGFNVDDNGNLINDIP